MHTSTLFAVEINTIWQTCLYCYMGPFLNGFLVLVVPPLVLTALALIMLNKIGRGLGLEKLFNHADGSLLARGFIGMGVGSLVWQACVCGYFYERFASTYSKDYEPWVDRQLGFQHPAADIWMLLRYAVMILVCMAVSGLAGIALFALFEELGKRLTKQTRESHSADWYHRWAGLVFTVSLVTIIMGNYYFIGQYFDGARDFVVGLVLVLAVLGVGFLVWPLVPTKSHKINQRPRDPCAIQRGPFWIGFGLGIGLAIWFTSACFPKIERNVFLYRAGSWVVYPHFPDGLRWKTLPTSWLERQVEWVGKQTVVYAGYGHEAARNQWNEILKSGWRKHQWADLDTDTFRSLVREDHRHDIADLKKRDTIPDWYLDKDALIRYYRTEAVTEYTRYYFVFGIFFLNVLVVFLVYLFNYVEWVILGKRGFFSPAVGIILLMHILMAADVIIPMFTPHPALTKAGTLFVILLLGGLRIYKLKFPGLDYHTPVAYPGPLTAPPTASENNPVPLLRNGKPLCPWRPEGITNAPLVVVCANGGGSRAAAWATAVMGRLEYEFAHAGYALPYHIRLVTGASGGMLGMANYVTRLDKPTTAGRLAQGRCGHTPVRGGRDWPTLTGTCPQQLREWLMATGITNDWLTPTCHRMLYLDIPGIFFPWLAWGLPDRGVAIQEAWRHELGDQEIATTFDNLLQQAHREPWRPQLVFSPMLVEDGRQLLISNLDLSLATLNKVANNSAGQATILSRAAVELFRLLTPDRKPGEADSCYKNRVAQATKNFTVATAARMSATFPYVLPAVPLPTNPPRRVVDAGYYDNYGVQIASAWLKTHRQWIRDHYSGVLIIQIRDGLSEDARRLASVVPSAPGILAERSLHWLTSPLSALLSARMASNSFRNDNLLDVLDTIFTNETKKKDFFRVASFEFDVDDQVSLSFRLTNREVDDIARAAHQLRGVDELVQWWGKRLER